MNIYEKLLAVQSELKAPKSQYNSFGKYNYRNCEDILEAVKPLCVKNKAVLILSDEIEAVGERYYIKAVATFYDTKSADKVIATARAREEESKKGMDGSQVTGAASSYARKYALNGLFDIDDTKDSDTTNTGNNDKQPAQKEPDKPQEMTYDEACSLKTKDGRLLKDLASDDLDKVAKCLNAIYSKAANLILEHNKSDLIKSIETCEEPLPF